MNRPKLRADARTVLRGKWGWAVSLTLLSGVICGAIAWLLDGASALITSIITVGVDFTLLELVDTGRKESNYFTAMFSAFTKGRLVPVFLTWLFSSIFTTLWTILLIVPGIIKSLAYSQSQYIVKDMVDSGQSVAATEAITKSRQIMDGHKWEYFVLQLSFIGWILLGCIPCGIGLLWVTPYIRTTNAEYYRNLVGDKFKHAEKPTPSQPTQPSQPSQLTQPTEPATSAQPTDTTKTETSN